MSILSASNLSKHYGPDEIFSGISIAIPVGARIALVGPNGAGKTTLLNLLAGIDSPTGGRLNRARGARLSFLPQRPELTGEHSLWHEQLRAFAVLRAKERRLADLEQRMADGDDVSEALDDYGTLQADFERLGGYEYETRIKMALGGLGFSPTDYARLLPQLSGGEKTRAALCRLLLEESDLLILDEPTNHLDIHAVEWLEKYLASFPGALLAVSHDRFFINKFATAVWEIEYGKLRTYRGNYSAFSEQRAAQRETLRHDFYWQQQFMRKEEAFIRRHMGSRLTAQAKGRLKKLETMKKRGAVLESGPRGRKRMVLEMSDHARSGDQVIVTRDLQLGYDAEAPLLSAPDLLVLRGETVAIIGGNGVGKSTLLKTLSGALPPLAGKVHLGAKVRIGYFAQAHETLKADNAVIDEIRAVKALPLSQARDWLGRFLFSGDDVFRPVSSLSGGERGRVALAKLALQGASLLLLDEPTNHLDIDSQEVLQAALAAFDGTILLVSHDRYLVDALATQIWEISPGRLRFIDGDYQTYLRQRNGAIQHEAAQASANSRRGKRSPAYREKRGGLNPFEAAQRTAALEAEIERLEASLNDISRQLDAASLAQDAGMARQLGLAYTQTEAELEAALDEWSRFAV
ncbi:MAG: ABC-F family ATP-binding cassette domain-containing protein [Chloroflexota bacterium]|nr:ABC-F family ATP-binding cassette domain-containing protein [Chloroflexota bacterium]MDE2907855.1 ABC-F family ATP-binding cassette domain-containing protein [Chloroflexota bacterium]